MKTKLIKDHYRLLTLRVCVGRPGGRNGAGHVYGAAAIDASVCSEHMLRGLYLMSWDGYANVGGNLVPKAVMDGKRFNGDGTWINDFGKGNIGGTTIINSGGGGGTYTVAADCTGTLSVPNGPSFNMYIGPGGQKFWFTQTAGGLVRERRHGSRSKNSPGGCRELDL